MIAILVPSFETVDAAMEWVHAQGEVIRVCLMLGNDGQIRGNALVKPRPWT